LLIVNFNSLYEEWRRGVAVECRTCDQEITGSSLSRALRRKNSEQVSYTYVLLSPSSIIWYRQKLGSKQACHAIH